MIFPKQLNVGSGKDFRDDYLNIDIGDYWSPDVICDLGKPLFEKSAPSFDSKRFGRITLAKTSFNKIIAYDVLEHIPDLVTAMTNCLHLLKMGGIFEIYVPYDLSYGAWQDPTHLRAFNERSWLYYTDWFWYLGWKDARFNVDRLQMEYSPVGVELINNGLPQDALLRTPRAIDAMTVQLVKVGLSENDKQALKAFEDRREALAAAR